VEERIAKCRRRRHANCTDSFLHGGVVVLVGARLDLEAALLPALTITTVSLGLRAIHTTRAERRFGSSNPSQHTRMLVYNFEDELQRDSKLLGQYAGIRSPRFPLSDR
jgi:hypothetical protein